MKTSEVLISPCYV